MNPKVCVTMLMPAMLSILAFAPPTDAQRKKHFNLGSNSLAIEGYDPVAYQVSNKAVEGKSSVSYSYHGALYYFSSQNNLQKFKTDPAKYEPAYGGWCAYAMGNSGEKVEVDPETFKILNGKTYLFYNAYFNNTKTKWDANEKQLKAKADIHWNKIISK